MKGIIIINQNSLYNKIVAFLFAVYAFIGLNPYFLWSTYRNGIFTNVHGISTEALLGMVLIFVTAYGVFTKNNRIKKDDVVLIIFTIILTLYIMLLSGGILHNVKNGLWIRFFIVICFFFQPIQIRTMSYRVYLTIFALTAVLPIIYYALSNIGISIKYEKLKSYEPIKINKFYYYKHYPFASQIANVYSPEIERRLSGIYDEAGRLGTMAAMFLCSENYNLKKTNNKIIFVAGVLSFSLAFYIMSFVYFMLKCLEKRKIKSVLLILALVGAYFIFINLKISNEQLRVIQSRVVFTEDGLSGDNRASKRYDLLFQSFLTSSSMNNRLFGNGIYAMEDIQYRLYIDGSSYKSMIYDYGFIGIFLIVTWLVLFSFIMIRHHPIYKKYISSQLIIFLINLYQRPNIASMSFLLIFLGGVYEMCYDAMSEHECWKGKLNGKRIFDISYSNKL